MMVLLCLQQQGSLAVLIDFISLVLKEEKKEPKGVELLCCRLSPNSSWPPFALAMTPIGPLRQSTQKF
jgi:hypothetical protein